MKNCITTIFAIALIFFIWALLPAPVSAQLPDRTNIFGIHVISPSAEEFREACRMVGEWGWITMVVDEESMQPDQLQGYFNIAFEEKCLVVVRISTKADSKGNRLMPTERTTRYIEKLVTNATPPSTWFIQLGNEINHGAELAGDCTKADDFARWMSRTEKAIHAIDDKAIVMAPALDKATPDAPPAYCDPRDTYKKMVQAAPEFFNSLQVLSVHNYFGGHNKFGGSPVVGHRNELEYLKGLGVQNVDSMKVLITETGGRTNDFGEDSLVYSLDSAIQYWKNDPKVLGFTYFVYKACDQLSPFSLITCDTNQRNMVGDLLFSAEKTAGNPWFRFGATTTMTYPKDIPINYKKSWDIFIKNKSTDAFRREDYKLSLLGTTMKYSFSDFHYVKPGEVLKTTLTVNPGNETGCPTLRLGLMRKGRLVLELADIQPCVHPAPSFELTQIKTVTNGSLDGQEGHVQFFDPDENIVFEGIGTIVGGILSITGVTGVDFDQSYRGVLLVNGCLPQQWYTHFQPGNNSQEAKTLWPLDRNGDGELSYKDVLGKQ